jgi:hypothetical protein
MGRSVMDISGTIDQINEDLSMRAPDLISGTYLVTVGSQFQGTIGARKIVKM